MGHLDDQMHQLTGLDEHFAHGLRSKRPNILPGPEHEFMNRNVLPPDPRPPALGYMPLPEPRAELSHPFSQEPYHFADRRTDRPLNGRNLSLRAMTNSASMPEYTFLERANTDSPSQRAQSVQSAGPGSLSLYPLPQEDAVTSSKNDRLLPSFHQLSKIADSGTEASDTRTVGLPNLTAYANQVVAQNVTTSHPHFPPSQQSSPPSNFVLLGHPSPTNTRADGHEMYPPSHSPASFSVSNHDNSRRRSAQPTRPPPFIPSMTSSSMGTVSSSENMSTLQSCQDSEAGGRSTAHTTPMESTPSSFEGTPRTSVPRLQTSTSAPGGFICDHPGCAAPPFQTQYLLNSSRPHYCPVKGCPRGEGGKGFKRKNEMIRHGLVHDSPGYVCPFCPLREHRYPRPDNLQRHVRVHHVDKDKDDPLLREVLAQRPEGGGRGGRRRRTGPA
ncbi:unnamed protein product [Aureobasidium uvarum]|uniref:C2H2-type domain-containing protein n=1 Tax=Aureobasidium uvarum TaxID=2773716 RepID=A0A9N8KTB1_9PEZI|nr:unnamed protein product [Aureobasidium uvarum]